MTAPLLVFPRSEGEFLVFRNPSAVFRGTDLEAAERDANVSGGVVAGGWQYSAAEESSPGWWGVFPLAERWNRAGLLALASEEVPLLSPLLPEWSSDEYEPVFGRVREALARGETYQINLTFGLNGHAISSSAWSPSLALRLWLELLAPDGDPRFGQGRHGAFAWFGDSFPLLLSLSPELLFERQERHLVAKPMKGTALRDRDPSRDEQNRLALLASEKDRAENLMITDMLRNDLGRLAVPGSVRVPRLFEVEAYPTVWQMTSTVEADLPETPVSLLDLLTALAPCASITGAPKLRSQQLIGALESQPRGWYTGTLGWSEGSVAHFNVLIRTLVFASPHQPQFRLGVGGGVVWDSRPGEEYAEALAKSRFLQARQRPFDLLESLRWDPSAGYGLAAEHFERLQASAAVFGTPVSRQEFDRALALVGKGPVALKVRVLLKPDGRLTVEASPLGVPTAEVTWALAPGPWDPASRLLREHKTTAREAYEALSVPGADQTVYWTPDKLLTEGTTTNVVLKIGQDLLTPSLAAGLLPGTFRRHLLETGVVREAVLTVDDCHRADEIWLVNSVRGWQKGKPFQLTRR